MEKKVKKLEKDESSKKPVSEGDKPHASAGRVSGSPDSVGGSREGNVGHESSAETGRGDRQV